MLTCPSFGEFLTVACAAFVVDAATPRLDDLIALLAGRCCDS